MPGSGGDGGALPDYFRVPVGASWETRVIGRFPKIGKPWNIAKDDHRRASSEVRMMIVLIAVKSCRTPRRGRPHRRARKRGTSPSARVHRGRAAQTRHRRLGDVMDTPQNGVQRRRDGMRRPATAAIRPGGSFHRGRHGRPTIRAGLHVILPATVSPESRIAVANHTPKPGDVYAEGRTCLPRSRMGAVPLISGAGRYSSCHHRRSRQSMTLSITHRIVPSCPRPKG